ncbi:hypothetical protein HUG10_00210 [Halorarum halophilum]|uniref:Uncharacterized protein n=1 Tax=Halorarum halophilum TaxID=2743090 RepID=A0A7D5KBM4_9EURY|nr:hypothetical protein [Halobaculum halophilum]QLG26057.1 hypothetical protein HUG10_00210 [Halobaculum halophilum]
MSVRGRLPRLPRSRRDARLVGRTVRLVLGVPLYAIVALGAAALALSGFVLSQNVALVRDTVLGGALPLDARLTILVEQYPFVGTSYGPLAGLLLGLVALLTGVNVAVAAYHVREHGISLGREGGDVSDVGDSGSVGGAGGAGGAGSAIGVLLGALGAGCAACGSAVLVGLLSLVGGSGLLLLLPFEGVEFTLFALVPLGLSLYWLAEGMRGGEIRGCPVDLD